MSETYQKVFKVAINYTLGVPQTVVVHRGAELVYAELVGEKVELHFLSSNFQPKAMKLVLHNLDTVVDGEAVFLCIIPILGTCLKSTLWELPND